jgi:hypothetical protein
MSRFNLKLMAIRNKFRIRRMKVIRPNVNIEAEYYSIMRGISLLVKKKFLRIAESMAKPRVAEQWQDADYNSELEKLIAQVTGYVRSEYSQTALIDLIRRVVLKTDRYHSFWYKKAAAYGFGIDIDKLPEFEGYKPFLRSAIKKNLSIIKNIKEDALFRTEMSLRTAIQQGKSIAQVRNEIMESDQITKRRAATIARNEIKNITSELNQKRAVNAGFEIYEWLGAEDQRERGNPNGLYPHSKTNHWIMNGVYCRYDDGTVYSDDKGKTWKKRKPNMPIGEPGTCDINCRCDSLPVA